MSRHISIIFALLLVLPGLPGYKPAVQSLVIFQEDFKPDSVEIGAPDMGFCGSKGRILVW